MKELEQVFSLIRHAQEPDSENIAPGFNTKLSVVPREALLYNRHGDSDSRGEKSLLYIIMRDDTIIVKLIQGLNPVIRNASRFERGICNIRVFYRQPPGMQMRHPAYEHLFIAQIPRILHDSADNARTVVHRGQAVKRLSLV